MGIEVLNLAFRIILNFFAIKKFIIPLLIGITVQIETVEKILGICTF
jgi:hypothetical protein